MDLVEEPGQVLSADFVGNREEILGPRVPELPALEERGQDALQRVPSEMRSSVCSHSAVLL